MDKIAENLIYDIWYTLSERLFEQIAKECNLSTEQRDALWHVLMRPNDYTLQITN